MRLRRGKQWTHLSSFAHSSVNNDAMRVVDDGGDCGGYYCWLSTTVLSSMFLWFTIAPVSGSV
jgi:hypothetical protein